MRNLLTSNQLNSFKNPFEDINANILDAQKILEFWCTPFDKGILGKLSESEFATQKLPIILEGARGSGKTTILKYFSYPVQKQRAKHQVEKSILKQLIEEKSNGFYFRCDDSFVNTFKSIFKAQKKDEWLVFFEHYLEIQFSKHIVNVIRDCLTDNLKIAEVAIISNIKEKFDFQNSDNIMNLEDLYHYLNSESKYIDRFKNELIFKNTKFNPSCIFKLYSLSEILVKEFIHNLAKVKDMAFIILIDEFESLTPEMQQLFNTILKYSRQNITFRIGRRSEGLVETGTINNEEYLRINNDYTLVKINSVTDKSEQIRNQKIYFEEIARKRFEKNSFFDEIDSISNILGKQENLDKECIEICKNRTTHIELIISQNDKVKYNKELKEQIVKTICYPNDPIAETINALWVSRSKTDLLITAQSARKAMYGFLNKEQNENVKKYKNDYSNKYRYAATVLLASIYKTQKLYYSFNTVAYLSEGNTRTFINLCRAIISDALFYEKNEFVSTKLISKESQNRAIREFSNSEFDGICSIISYGEQIRNLVINIGNELSEYHKDKKMRYPETTQFAFVAPNLDPQLMKVMDVAESWSMIIKKDKKQRISVSSKEKGDLYRLNRIFCPIFSISFRTRGGFNLKLNAPQMQKFSMPLNPDEISGKGPTNDKDNIQMTLFDSEV